MLPAELLNNVLRCPGGTTLTQASDAQVARINAVIREGQLHNRAGNRVEKQIDGGLVQADGAWLYPIIDEIPVLLRDDAISMKQFTN